ncbi:uncharacterized protein LOC119742497 [Patiria miniata]|uniref:Septin-type G domain-containing protein n=1 Tax=Patiria miniata TaxID=46514 RepID=A0A914BER4_PATMI|nr:uncharacterized protein LOC119742497 [Patiria miniata]
MGTTSDSSVARYAEHLAHQSTPIVSSEVGHPDVFLVPLKMQSVSSTQTFRSYSCGVPSRMHSPHKVIMVVGETGTGKSTFINAMINYILEVKWEDNFRFKLVHDRGEASGSQAYSQTQNITSYTINNNYHINVPYTLTLIDTPGFGDTRGIERDKAIVEQIREFFSHPEAHGVDHIDAVGFVVQSSQARLTPAQKYVFESILAIFGKDIESNIVLLITFCDGQSPNVLEAIHEAKLTFDKTFKFNNSALLASRGDVGMSFDAMVWQMGYTSMKEFFYVLDDLQPQSLSLTVEVLEERKSLEVALEGLQSQILFAWEQTEQLKKDKKILEEHEKEIQANKSFEYMVNAPKLEKVRDEDKGSTNCSNCLYTCHHPCTFSQGKLLCHAIKKGYCTVCPGKCSLSDHVHEYFRYHWKMVKEKQTYADIKNQYRDAQGRKQTREEVIKCIETDLVKSEAAVSELIDESHRCTQRLREIALKPDPIGVMDYLDMLIESEKETKTEGWQMRVVSLENAKRQANTKAVVKDAHSLGNIRGRHTNGQKLSSEEITKKVEAESGKSRCLILSAIKDQLR